VVDSGTGPFEVVEILGEGSFGTVCVARVRADPLRRKVALKILKGEYISNPKIMNRTRDEARILSRLNHPNIVRVERLMEVAGRPVVVMEHVEGVSLDKLLLRYRNGLPPAIAIELIRQTLIALHVAYTEALGNGGQPLRVIHRDIKPSNILLSIHGAVKVVDFGIAKGNFEGREAETESVVMGSRPYMAPERLDGISDSPSVDVYSAGMSLFELLTGRHMTLSINPVTHEQAMNRQLGYLKAEGIAPEDLDDLRGVLRRMCAYDRDYRPSSDDAQRDLQVCQAQVAVQDPQLLETFAETVVKPIYESRSKHRPKSGGQSGEEALLLGLSSQLSGSMVTTGPSTRLMPYLFLSGLTVAVVVLGTLAGAKWLFNTLDIDVPTGLAAAAAISDGLVEVKVWLPRDAQGSLENQYVLGSGRYRVHSGAQDLKMNFDDGRSLVCQFVATEGIAVRYVVESGQGGLSVDDELSVPCLNSGTTAEAR
jgi:serine/threonine protein kinase